MNTSDIKSKIIKLLKIGEWDLAFAMIENENLDYWINAFDYSHDKSTYLTSAYKIPGIKLPVVIPERQTEPFIYVRYNEWKKKKK